jgi:acyl-CoA thioester hydrolase
VTGTGAGNGRVTRVTLRVRFAETDAFGFAYHGAYFAWFEAARTQWLRERGMTYRDLMRDDVHLPVVSTEARFLKPVAYDDELAVDARLEAWTGVRLGFRYELRRRDEDAVLTTARTEHAAVDGSGKLRRLPARIVEILDAAR